ncbi:hypothetical protein PILCRDRAFT_827664 [Piloderma croceum F 1598]|uniref:Uncharacterized protein n=1 Tax=Piloderma croceum (strain F 1598) TaxID=765440 RepID=A0A0C3BCU5_PILCF|nr:hypothetical protein PILCRDRAFT_827664 [Piloderma croceum F 1598]
MTYTRTESIHHHTPMTGSKANPLQSPKRPTQRDQTHENSTLIEGPWKHMARTYTWVVEQEQTKLEKKNKKTEKWVVEQQSFLADRSNHEKTNKPQRRRTWEELMEWHGVDAKKQSGKETAARRGAIEREREKARMIEEEIRRIQARVQKKKESEKQRLAEEKWRATEAQKESQKQERARADVGTSDVWRTYEARWASIAASSEPLTFRTIPWPLTSSPSNAAGILPAGIISFLLSPLHSKNQTRKERIRSALLRWHPDRFRKFVDRVVEAERESVQEGVGIVARCLNELMERENRVSRHLMKGSKTW